MSDHPYINNPALQAREVIRLLAVNKGWSDEIPAVWNAASEDAHPLDNDGRQTCGHWPKVAWEALRLCALLLSQHEPDVVTKWLEDFPIHPTPDEATA